MFSNYKKYFIVNCEENNSSSSSISPVIPSSSSSSSSSTSSSSLISTLEGPISKVTFFSAAIAVFSISALLGIHRAVRKEGTTLKNLIKNENSNFLIATKAFVYGTALAFTASAAATSIFIYTSGKYK